MEQMTIMKDEDITVIAPTKAITKGHLVVIPNKEYLIMEQVPEAVLAKMFQIANRLSSILFDSLGSQGTNFLIQNGTAAGQVSKVFSISVIPRFENDGVSLEWTPSQADEASLKAVQDRFSAIDEEEQDKKRIAEQKKQIEGKKDEEVIDSDKENYIVKSLDRLP